MPIIFIEARINLSRFVFFFFNDTATTEIYTLSLHDALPISGLHPRDRRRPGRLPARDQLKSRDRKSTRLNSSHQINSYAVFCSKKKNKSPMSQTIRQKHKMHTASNTNSTAI